MSKKDHGRFYPDLNITVAGRQATRYRTVYDIQDELEEAQAEANFSERSVTPYDHSINSSVGGSLNNDQFVHDDLESASNIDRDVPPERDLRHTKAEEMIAIIEEMTGADYTGLFVSGAPGLQAQTITFQRFIEELENHCRVSIRHLILIDEKPLNKLVSEFQKVQGVAVRDETVAELEGVIEWMQTDTLRAVAERDEMVAGLEGVIEQMQTDNRKADETVAELEGVIERIQMDTGRAVAERDETVAELEGRIAEMELIHRENRALKARISEGMMENERLRGRVREAETQVAQENAGLKGTVVTLRNHNKFMEEKLNKYEGLPSGLCRTCHRIDPDEAGGHYH